MRDFIFVGDFIINRYEIVSIFAAASAIDIKLKNDSIRVNFGTETDRKNAFIDLKEQLRRD